MSLKKHHLIPESVPVKIPGNSKEVDSIKHEIRCKFNKWIECFGPWQEPVELEIKVLSEDLEFNNKKLKKLSII
jgi:hypothetical protein